MSVKKIERLLETNFAALTGNEIVSLNNSYYFPYLLFTSDCYKSKEDYNSLIQWLYSNTIKQPHYFKRAIESFLKQLSNEKYQELLNNTENKYKLTDTYPMVQFYSVSNPIKGGKAEINVTQKVVEISRKNFPNVKIEFLEWLDLRLLNELKDSKPNELVYKTEIHNWIVLNIEKLLISTDLVLSTPKTKPKNLLEIWLPEKGDVIEMYNTYIEFLKKMNLETDSPFVTDTEKGIKWCQLPIKGWQLYLAGFIYTCWENGWINHEYSAPTFVEIAINTFGVKPSPNRFKSLFAKQFKYDEKYLKPFKSLPPKY